MTVTLRLSEYHFWSPTLGTDAVRFSLYDEHGQEYFCIRPMTGLGQSLRDLREHSALRIHEAMEQGAEPGEVN